MSNLLERENDLYWAAAAKRAYQERKTWVAECLRKSGGVIEGWMYYQITLDDLADLLAGFSKIKLPSDRDIAARIKTAWKQRRRHD